MRLYGEVFVSPIKAVSRRSREFWPRTTQFLTCASFFAHHLHSLLTLCLKLLAGLSQDSPVEQQKAMRFGADPDFMRLAFRCIFASIWICAWMLLLWCACLLCRFYGCVYSLYLCPCLRLCLCFCLCRCTGPCACALCLCMCIICASIHIVKKCFFVCQVSPVLSWMGLFFNSRGLFPSPSNWANSEVVWSMCPTYPGQALWNTRFPAGVLPSPARYSFWVHIRKRPQRLEVGCGDRAWTWRKRQVFDWCVTLCLITNRSLPLRVLRLLCRQKLQMLSSISKVSSLWWLMQHFIPLVVLILFSAQETWQPWQPWQPWLVHRCSRNYDCFAPWPDNMFFII